jgi:hypothetical protein
MTKKRFYRKQPVGCGFHVWEGKGKHNIYLIQVPGKSLKSCLLAIAPKPVCPPPGCLKLALPYAFAFFVGAPSGRVFI